MRRRVLNRRVPAFSQVPDRHRVAHGWDRASITAASIDDDDDDNEGNDGNDDEDSAPSSTLTPNSRPCSARRA
jgi:hypothetical protein